MAKILFLKAKNECELLEKKVEDGCVIIEDKQFLIDTSYPLLLKKRFGGVEPLYIVKWNEVQPATNLNPIITESIKPEFKGYFKDLTPEMLRKIMGMKILGNMIPVRKPLPNIFLMFLGVIIGITILYSLIALKLLPVI